MLWGRKRGLNPFLSELKHLIKESGILIGTLGWLILKNLELAQGFLSGGKGQN